MNKTLLLAFTCLLLCGPSVLAEECHETVVIDSVEYSVGERWCGKMLDSTDLADKDRLVQIPEEFSFEDYRIYIDRDARDAFVAMAETGKADSVFLIVDSGYRSASYQARIIQAHLEKGERFADLVQYVAPPGYSEHETGRAIDMVPSDQSFSRTNAYLWLVDNAGAYGFVETFPNDSTGVMPWEPWHWTYCPDER